MIKKFRVWDTELNWFCEPLNYFIRLDGSVWFRPSAGGMFDLSHKFVVEQSTGLMDKNDKEIFEGDILADNNGNEPVFFNPDVGAWAVKDEDGNSMLLADCVESMTIVGNIHENPELLETTPEERFFVLVLNDGGQYLAQGRFPTQEAAEHCKDGVSETRNPVVVKEIKS